MEDDRAADLLNMSLDDIMKKRRSAAPPKRGGKGAGAMARQERQARAVPFAGRPQAPASGPPRGQAGSAVLTGTTTRLWCGNLAYTTTSEILAKACARAGEVVGAEVLTRASDGKSKGYGIVEFRTVRQAASALRTLQDAMLNGRPMLLHEDHAVGTRPAAGGNNGGVGVGSLSGGGGGGGGGRNVVGGNSKVFVGNLAYTTTWQNLKDHFRQAGNILRADVVMGADGRSRGWGVVEFSSAAEARRAIQSLHDTDLNGRLVFVREDRGTEAGPEPAALAAAAGSGGGRWPAAGGQPAPRQLPPGNQMVGGGVGTRLYVGNLPYGIQPADLEDHFLQAGEVAFVDIATSSDGRSRGFAIVEYRRRADAARAIRQLNESILMERPLLVREDMGSTPGGGGGGVPHGGGGQHVLAGIGGGGRQVFVNHVGVDTTWQDLKDLFKTIGPVRVDIPEEQRGRARHATAVFASADAAASAVQQFNGATLNGSRLMVKIDRAAD